VKGSLAAVVVALLVCAFAAPALAESGTSIDIYQKDTQPGHAAALSMYLDITKGQPATSRVTVYVPSGSALDTAARAGTVIGSVSLGFYTASTPVFGDGDLIVGDPSLHLADPCAPGLHAAVWRLQAYLGGHNIEVPIYVDGTGPDLAGIASYTLSACFPAPSENGGLRLNRLGIGLSKGTLSSPLTQGQFIWRALVAPYGGDELTNASGTTEVQTIVELPKVLTLASRFDAKRHVATLSGSLRAAGGARPDTLVRFMGANNPRFTHAASLGSTRTDAHGRFTFRKELTKTTWVVAYVETSFVDGCDLAVGTAPCTLETMGGPAPVVRKVRVQR
jgi:hypothetical protein